MSNHERINTRLLPGVLDDMYEGCYAARMSYAEACQAASIGHTDSEPTGDIDQASDTAIGTGILVTEIDDAQARKNRAYMKLVPGLLETAC